MKKKIISIILAIIEILAIYLIVKSIFNIDLMPIIKSLLMIN